MTKQELLDKINETITTKTAKNSITPISHGGILNDIVNSIYDYIAAEIESVGDATDVDVLQPLSGTTLPSITNGNKRIYFVKQGTYTTEDGSVSIEVGSGERAILKFNGEQWNKISIDELAQDVAQSSENKAISQAAVLSIKRELEDKLRAASTQVDLTEYAKKTDLNDYLQKDISTIEESEKDDILSHLLYLYDTINAAGKRITIKNIAIKTSKKYERLNFVAGESTATIPKTYTSFDFDTSKVTINGVAYYPTIDYIIKDATTIQFDSYSFDRGDKVVMEGLFFTE